jgi:hypothetical protein
MKGDKQEDRVREASAISGKWLVCAMLIRFAFISLIPLLPEYRA